MYMSLGTYGLPLGLPGMLDERTVDWENGSYMIWDIWTK